MITFKIEQPGTPAIHVNAPDSTTALLSHLNAVNPIQRWSIKVIEDDYSACDYIVSNKEYGIRIKFQVMPLEDGEVRQNQESNVKKHEQISRSSWVATLILCVLLTGVHRIYVGKIGTGILMLLMNIFSWCGIFAAVMEGEGGAGLMIIPFLIWFVIDLVKILRGTFADKQKLIIRERRI